MEEIIKRRLFAFIIDFLVVNLMIWALTLLFYPFIVFTDSFFLYNYWPILLVILTISYFSYFEYHGGTIGKLNQRLKVVSKEGELKYKQVIIRNLPKICWFPLILDVILGYNKELRLFDKIAGTKVITGNQ
ncbi:MAG: RDD family protein [Methanothermobacter sp.]